MGEREARPDQRRWLEEQFLRHGRLVRAVIWNRLGRPQDSGLVDELAAETWSRAVSVVQERPFDTQRDFRPWICAVASNVCREHGRRQRRATAVVELEEPADDPREVARVQELLDLHTAVAECVSRLSAEDRTVYELRFEQGLSGREVASRIGVPESTFRTVVMPRLLRAVASCLAKKGFGGSGESGLLRTARTAVSGNERTGEAGKEPQR